MARIGVDVGGTFTDLVLEKMDKNDCAKVFVHKVASTPHDQSVGVLRGVLEICELAGVKPSDITMIVHGTTVATNITIEHNGAEVGMLTTRGFRDILHIGRHKRPPQLLVAIRRPWQSHPLVRRRNRIAITERIMPPMASRRGTDEEEVLEAARCSRRAVSTSVIVCFLYSFLNDTHERRAKALVQSVLPDAYVSCSSEVVNVIREYERFSTTAMNAFVGPKTALYLNNLEAKLREAGINAHCGSCSRTAGYRRSRCVRNVRCRSSCRDSRAA